MKEAKFIHVNKEKWKQMEDIYRLDADTLAANYLILSDDLSYAQTFYPGSKLVLYLNKLIGSYQINIYSRQKSKKKSIVCFWTTDFPRLLYRHRKILWFSVCFFVGAMLVGAFSASEEQSFVRFILGDTYVDQTLENIAAGKPMGVYSSAGEWTMFVSITANNIKVSFMAFVLGLLFSAGTLWILFINGVMLGAFQYFFFQQGLLLQSLLSVWAHGTFEITSIVIAGGAGLVMGNGFLFPGTYHRFYSFRKGALEGIKIVVGLIPFFIIAGGIESFITRYADAYPLVGAIAIVLSWGCLIGYFLIYPSVLHKNNSYEKD